VLKIKCIIIIIIIIIIITEIDRYAHSIVLKLYSFPWHINAFTSYYCSGLLYVRMWRGNIWHGPICTVYSNIV